MSLSIFGFEALWSPWFFVLLLLIGLVYFLITVKYRTIISKNSEPLKPKQAILFVLSLLILYTIKGSPLDLLGHIMFSVHMTQMACLYLVLPPILINAIPNWLWRRFLSIKVIRPLFHFFTKPLIALLVFNALFSFYHIPYIFDVVKTNMMLHSICTIILFVTAILMWWPIINSLEEYQGFYGIKRIGYIFANGILLTPACGLIIFANHPIYETYSNSMFWLQAMELCVPTSTLSNLNISGPELFNFMPIVDDQKTGGVIMKIIQEIVFGVVLAKIFFAWYRQENTEDVDMNPVSDKYQME
ncbi:MULTISPECIES: cytochrome c oxidase assembly factor CtaG [Bacillus]|uniref:cytochrome c oxidase assembly factor CtaG n=1 Tax=Bacillus TaxID=1386 RepID=UPI00047823E8|nr:MULTISPECIES: cytochrome c oxidase assembly factor CtaG [Bacillus]